MDRMVAGAVLVLLGVIYQLVASGRREAGAREAFPRDPCPTVGEIMSRPAWVARQDLSVQEAAETMLDRDVGCLPVVDATGGLVGIVTESDLTGMRTPLALATSRRGLIGAWVRAAGEQAYEDAKKQAVGDVMTTRVVTATAAEPVRRVVVRMMDHDLHHLPVVEHGAPVGVLARHDLLRLLAEPCR